jgi:hypothetical protein
MHTSDPQKEGEIEYMKRKPKLPKRTAKWHKKLTAKEWRHLCDTVKPGVRPTLQSIRNNREHQIKNGIRCFECKHIAITLGLEKPDAPSPKINIDALPGDVDLIANIVRRANRLGMKKIDIVSLMMDITATHLNDTPLDLKGLLEANLTDFVHDVFGIMKNIDRRMGKLEDGFVPRYAARREQEGAACR